MIDKKNKKYIFKFKEFTVVHEKSAMKVGFDGILLGAWCKVSNANYILDIGTGSGLIALMAAQKNSQAFIYAIEPHYASYVEAIQNIKRSPWSNRIKILNRSLQSFFADDGPKFDHIICNPPFFSKKTLPNGQNQIISKHKLFLTDVDLIKYSAGLLNFSGKLSLIIPYENKDSFISLSNNAGFHLSHLINIITKKGMIKRVLMEFVFKSKNHIEKKVENLHIYDCDGKYSTQYVNLVKDFYIKNMGNTDNRLP